MNKGILKPAYIKLFSVISIFGIGILSYSNTFLVPFQFDDRSSIVDNFAIRNICHLQAIWDFLPRRFLLYLTLAFNYHFSGMHVLGYHVFNLSVHLATAFLVWWLTLLTFSTPALKKNKIAAHAQVLALLTGLVFVAHPLQTQAVTYIVQRAASMATMFYLLSLSLYAKSRLAQIKSSTLGSWKIYYLGALAAAIAAMFTKETAITLPLMVLFYEFSFLTTDKKVNWKPLAPFLLTLIIIPLTIAMTESPAALQMRGVIAEGPTSITSGQYFLTEFRVMVTYIRLVFLPVNQNLDYDYPVLKNIFEWPAYSSFIFLMSILFLARHLFSKYRVVSFSIIWFFVTLMPESSIWPIKDVINEHRLYLPMAGFSLLLTSVGYYLLGSRSFKAMTIIFIMLIGGLGALTYQRNMIWGDVGVLWEDTLKKSPQKARPNNNCGYFLDKKGEYAKALVDLDKAIAAFPGYADAYNNRGMVHYHQGLLISALADLSQAIKINPRFAEAYVNRGAVLGAGGHFAEAMADDNQALALNPNSVEGYNNRGNVYVKLQKYAEAVDDLKRAVDVDPEFAQTYNNLAVVFYQLKEYDKAWDNLQKARKLGFAVNQNFFNAVKNMSGNSFR